MIGLIDMDLYETNKITIPNLEVMKLAEYYRVEENTFSRLILPGETNVDQYDTLYVCSNFSKNIPAFALRHKDMRTVGPPYYGGKYIPFENELIEYSLPRTTIYKEFLRSKHQIGENEKEINNFLDNTYYRISVNDKILPIPVVIPKKRVYLYDTHYDYTKIPVLQDIANRRPSTILYVFPLIVQDLDTFFEIRKTEKISKSNAVILDLNVPHQELFNFLKKMGNKLKAEIPKTSSTYLPFGAYPTKKQTTYNYCRELISALNKLYTYWAAGVPIGLKYYPPDDGTKNPLEDLFKRIENFSNAVRFDKQKRNKIIYHDNDRIPIREQMAEFLKYFPTYKHLFQQTWNEITKRKYWEWRN